MAKIRSIKPDFFLDDALVRDELEMGLPRRALRIIFAGLWTQCDRKGLFRWRPAVLRVQICPFDDDLDVETFEKALSVLCARGSLQRYTGSDGKEYGHVTGWKAHQRPRADEAKSILPPPPGDPGGDEDDDGAPTREPRRLVEPRPPRRAPAPRPERKPEPAPVSSSERTSNEHGTAFVLIPLRDDKTGRVDAADAAQWQEDFPGVDVEGALRRMVAHWREQPNSARWTIQGYRKGIVNWLKADADRERERVRRRAASEPRLPGECPEVGGDA